VTIMTPTREAEEYLEAVRRELADLPEEERGELLDDLAQHLADIAADDTRSGLPLTELLGDPMAYASELRAAAGLPVRPASSKWRRASVPSPRRWLNESAPGRWVNGPEGQARIKPLLEFGRELRPGWWVVRGYLVVAVLVAALGSGATAFPIPSILGSRVTGVLVVLLGIAVSVKVGRRPPRRAKPLIRALEVVVVTVALGLAVSAQPGNAGFSVRTVYRDFGGDPHGAALGAVTNIYPYGPDGRPLDGVLLFDQDGRPIVAAERQSWPDGCPREALHPRAGDGQPINYAYPRAYALDRRFYPDSSAEVSFRFAARCAQLHRPPAPIPVLPLRPAGEPQPETAQPQPAPEPQPEPSPGPSEPPPPS